MSEIIFNNTLTYAGGGKDFLNPLITSLFDQDMSSAELDEDLMAKLGFKSTRALTPDQKFSVIIGAYELSEITESEDIPDVDTGRGETKGFEIVQYGGKIGISKLFRKWIEGASSLEWADSSVKMERTRFAQNILSLRRGKIKRKNMTMTQLLTLGWIDSNAFGPWSPTPYGEPLFSATQPYREGTLTFSNLLSTPDDNLSSTSLQDALDGHKARLRLQNGDRVMTPAMYKLITGRELATTARTVLNTNGNNAGRFSGAGNNANQLNPFDINGNMVDLVENPFIGYLTQDGATIGTEDYWFLLNAQEATKASAMRFITLYDAEVNVYQNDSNNNTYVSMDMGYAVDHYGLESFIIGSRGTA